MVLLSGVDPGWLAPVVTNGAAAGAWARHTLATGAETGPSGGAHPADPKTSRPKPPPTGRRSARRSIIDEIMWGIGVTGRTRA